MKRQFTSLVLALLFLLIAQPVIAGMLATDPAAFNDGSFTWHGSTPFSTGTLVGYVDWAVYAPGSFPAGFAGYTPTPGEGTYAYQVFETGAAPLSSFKVGIISGGGANNIGTFSGGGVAGDAPTNATFDGTFSTAIFDFAGILSGNSSRGLAFSSSKTPVNFFGSVIDTGQVSLVTPLPSPNGVAGGPKFPEPSSLVMAGFGFGLFALRWLRCLRRHGKLRTGGIF